MRHWRKTTWAIVIWTALCVIWLAGGIGATADKAAANDAYALGAFIGGTFVLFIWFIITVVLSILWFATRPRATT